MLLFPKIPSDFAPGNICMLTYCNQSNNKSDARTDMFQTAHLLLGFPSALIFIVPLNAGAYRLDHCLSACPATWRKALGGADLLVLLASDARRRLKSWFRKSLIFTLFECKIEDHYILSLYFKIGWFIMEMQLTCCCCFRPLRSKQEQRSTPKP